MSPADDRQAGTGTSDRTAALGLADYLDAAEGLLRKYVVFPSEHELLAVVLWVAHTWLVRFAETSPILAITSAEMRSGKSRLLDVLQLLVARPFPAVTPSEAAVYTILDQKPHRTLLLDEIDTVFGPRTSDRYEGLRAILNSGNRRGSPIPRVLMLGKRRVVQEFDVFGPKAVAGIGSLPTTVRDRSIPVRLRRRAPGESVERFRLREARAAAASVRLDEAALEVSTTADVPDRLSDRAADSWEPLVAIADAAGGSWPERARQAAVALSKPEVEQPSVGARLLADIRSVMGDRNHMTTSDLLEGLHEIEDAPWSEWRGKPLSARGLARILEPYAIVPRRARLEEGNLRGYFRVDFEDAWERYLAPAPGEPEHPAQVEQPQGDAEEAAGQVPLVPLVPLREGGAA